MKTIILAGGMGTRLSEETALRPKPMVEIGGKPILWHIMNIYGAHKMNEFIVALGYKSEIIKEYFLNFYQLNNNVKVDLSTGKTELSGAKQPDWKVELIDTGLDTLTGGRVKRLEKFLKDEDTFMLTYGDGVGDVDIPALIKFHKSHGKAATLTCVRPPARFGSIQMEGDKVVKFQEKPQMGEGWINGGFFVLNKKAFDYIKGGDQISWERDPLEALAKDGELMAYKHHGFWQMMDTLRDKQFLEELWSSGRAPWKVWKD